jgi:hypothetical protein
VYRYECVLRPIVTAFLTAPIQGKYFSATVRSAYPARRLDADEVEQLMHLMRTEPLG